MNQPPLNPDAVAEAVNAAHGAVDWQMYEVTEYDLEDSVDVAVMAAVSAYLTAAQPVVNSVEELDALPFNTIAMFTTLPLDSPVPFELNTINGTDKCWTQPGDAAGYKSSMMARYLPARVLYRPEVK